MLDTRVELWEPVRARGDILLLERINPVDNQVIMKIWKLWARLITAAPQGVGTGLWKCLGLSTMASSLSKVLGRLLCKAKDRPALPSHQLAVDRLAFIDIRMAVLAGDKQTVNCWNRGPT